MSDISVISNQYEILIETSDKVNNSIIAFKKKYLLTSKKDKKYNALKVSDEEIKEASGYIVQFLSELSDLLTGATEKSKDIPTIIAGDYIEKLQSNIPSVKNDVDEIVKTVSAGESLEDEQLQTMDKILMTLDSERKVLFRKLRSS